MRARITKARATLAAAAVATLSMLAVAVLAMPALGDQATSPSGLVQSADVAHLPAKKSKSKKKVTPATIKVTLSLRTTNGTKPWPPIRVKIRLPKGLVLNYAQFPTCVATSLERNGLRACPKGSIVGKGTMRADGSPVLPNVPGRVTAVNGRNGTLLFYVVPDISSPLVIVGKLGRAPQGAYERTLDFPIPLVPTLPGQPNATLVDFQVTISGTATKKKRIAGKRRSVLVPFIANPTRCFGGAFQWRFDFSYENGESLSPTDAAPCR